MKILITKLMGFVLNVTAIFYPSFAARKGLELFSSPFRLTLKPEQVNFLKAAEIDEITLEESYQIKVYRWGNGSKRILMLHGWQSHSFRWIKYIQKMEKEDFTIFAFDAPGHGLSGGKLLNLPIFSTCMKAVIRRFGDMDFYMGHSMGAFAVLYSFHKLNDIKAKGLILLASPGNVKDYVDQYRKALGLSNKAYQLLIQHFNDLYKVDFFDFVAVKFQQNISIPALIIHDKGDLDTDYTYSVRLHEQWPNSKLLLTEGLGHKLRSPKIISEVLDFMNNMN